MAKKIMFGDFESKRVEVWKEKDGTSKIELDGEILIDTSNLFVDGTIIIDGLRFELFNTRTSGCSEYRNYSKHFTYRFNFKKDNKRKDEQIKRLQKRIAKIESTKHKLIAKSKTQGGQK